MLEQIWFLIGRSKICLVLPLKGRRSEKRPFGRSPLGLATVLRESCRAHSALAGPYSESVRALSVQTGTAHSYGPALDSELGKVPNSSQFLLKGHEAVRVPGCNGCTRHFQVGQAAGCVSQMPGRSGDADLAQLQMSGES